MSVRGPLVLHKQALKTSVTVEIYQFFSRFLRGMFLKLDGVPGGGESIKGIKEIRILWTDANNHSFTSSMEENVKLSEGEVLVGGFSSSSPLILVRLVCSIKNLRGVYSTGRLHIPSKVISTAFSRTCLHDIYVYRSTSPCRHTLLTTCLSLLLTSVFSCVEICVCIYGNNTVDTTKPIHSD